MIFDKKLYLEYNFYIVWDYSESPYFQVMTTHKKKRFDFFAEYHKEKISNVLSYVFSWIFSLAFAFAVVSYSQGGDMRWLMASVANLTPSTIYEADIIATNSGWVVLLIFGSEAKKVENISFTLVANPEQIKSLTTDSPAITLTTLEGGMYHGIIQMNTSDVAPGEIIARMNIVSDAGSIGLIDTKFVSEGKEYALTSAVQ